MNLAASNGGAIADRTAIGGVLQLLTGGRSPAAIIELVFGLFLISGMGFAYLGFPLVGWTVFLLRVALLWVIPGLVGEVDPVLGVLVMLLLWATLPLLSAFAVARLRRSAPPALGDSDAKPELEAAGWYGIAGLGWLASGRRAIGLTILVARLAMLGGSVVFLPLFGLAAADSCVDGRTTTCTALQIGVGFWFMFALALWLIFPVASAALLSRAEALETAKGLTVPRALLWIVFGLIALFVVPTVLGLLIAAIRF